MNSTARFIFINLLTNMQVFVIESDRDSRKIHSYLLEDYGAAVEAFSSFEEAIKTLNWLEPNLVICKMSFLDKDAQSFKRKLRDLEIKTGRHTPVIFPAESYVTDDAGAAEFTDIMHINLLQAVGYDYARARGVLTR